MDQSIPESNSNEEATPHSPDFPNWRFTIRFRLVLYTGLFFCGGGGGGGLIFLQKIQSTWTDKPFDLIWPTLTTVTKRLDWKPKI